MRRSVAAAARMRRIGGCRCPGGTGGGLQGDRQPRPAHEVSAGDVTDDGAAAAGKRDGELVEEVVQAVPTVVELPRAGGETVHRRRTERALAAASVWVCVMALLVRITGARWCTRLFHWPESPGPRFCSRRGRRCGSEAPRKPQRPGHTPRRPAGTRRMCCRPSSGWDQALQPPRPMACWQRQQWKESACWTASEITVP